MLRGKQLYKAAREYAEQELIPNLDTDSDISEEVKNEIAEKGANLGIALAIDVAESLHKIATKVG